MRTVTSRYGTLQALVICRGELSVDLSSLGGSEAGVEAEGVPPVVAGLAGPASGERRLAEAVERLSLTGPVARLAVQGQGQPLMVGGLLVAAVSQVDITSLIRRGWSGLGLIVSRR